MARINIEDCWWIDPRRERLGTLLGSMMVADAVVIRAWRVAQEFWGKGRNLVPKHVFETLEASSKLIEANLAIEYENGVYVRGSSQWLEWVNEEREKRKAGGQKSAQRPRDAKGRLLASDQVTSNNDPSESSNVQVSVSGSYSGSKEIQYNAPSELFSEKEISTLGTKFKPSDTQLQEIYSDFPRKKGRAKGFAKARAEIKSIHDLDDLKAAVSNYRQNCILEKKEPRFILHFSTFMAEWRDWIDPNHGTGEDFSNAEVRTLGGFTSV